jgi:hypothetical protein
MTAYFASTVTLFSPDAPELVSAGLLSLDLLSVVAGLLSPSLAGAASSLLGVWPF